MDEYVSGVFREDRRRVIQVIRNLESGHIRLNNWDNYYAGTSKMEKLVEAILSGIPLPPVYCNEEPDGNYIPKLGGVLLGAVRAFEGNHIRAFGKIFSELSPAQQNRFEDYVITLQMRDYRKEVDYEDPIATFY